jgi:hypothetical protein
MRPARVFKKAVFPDPLAPVTCQTSPPTKIKVGDHCGGFPRVSDGQVPRARDDRTQLVGHRSVRNVCMMEFVSSATASRMRPSAIAGVIAAVVLKSHVGRQGSGGSPDVAPDNQGRAKFRESPGKGQKRVRHDGRFDLPQQPAHPPRTRDAVREQDVACTQQASDRVFQLYQDWGQPEKAARWRARLRSGTP